MGHNQFSTPKAIRANFKSASDCKRHAGVPVYADSAGLWVDDSWRHVQVIGNTGEGKTQGSVLPFERNCLHMGENLIVLNTKDEDVREIAGHVPASYQKYHVNLADPYDSPDSWDPCAYFAALYHSGDCRDRDRACEAVYAFWSGMLKNKTFKDEFWPDSATDYLMGLTFGLLEMAKPEQVNLESIDSAMRSAEAKFAAQSYTRAFYDLLPEDSLAKTKLCGYVFSPNDTRMSTFATARQGLSVFGLSHGLRQLMMRDTLDIAHLDVDRPFVFFITMPQETGIYSNLAALLVNQLVSHLEYIASCRPDRRLPRRTHLVIEELGQVGHCIPSLPSILKSGRSKGFRVMTVMQSSEQLVEAYGEAQAKEINGCMDLTICYSTTCTNTLKKMCDFCGETYETVNGHPFSRPLITPGELRGMDVGEALIMTKNLKFRAHLPLYYQLTAGQERPEPAFPVREDSVAKPLDFRELVKDLKRKEMLNAQSAMRGTATGPNKRNVDGTLMRPPEMPWEEDEEPEAVFTRPPTVEAVNRIFNRKRNEGALHPKEEMPRGYNTIILDPGKNPHAVASMVAVMLSIPYSEAVRRLSPGNEPVKIPFTEHYRAEEAQRRLTLEGATAVVAPMMHSNR